MPHVSHLQPSSTQIFFKLLQGRGGGPLTIVTSALSPASGSWKVPCKWPMINNGRQYMASPKWMTPIGSVEGTWAHTGSYCNGVHTCQLFSIQEFKKASTSSTPPYNTHHTPRVMLYSFFFFFWRKHVGYPLSLPSRGTIVGILAMC